MNIALVGKFTNHWGAEGLVQRALWALSHEVYGISMMTPELPGPQFIETEEEARALVEQYEASKRSQLDGITDVDLTIIMQGYGLPAEAIERCRERSGRPVVLWHGEILGDHWPTDDQVVLGKVFELEKNIRAYDLVCHNCVTSLPMLTQLGAKKVAWVPVNGVDGQVHQRFPDIPKVLDLLIYGWPSERRRQVVKDTIDLLLQIRPDLTYVWPDPHDQCYGDVLMRAINAAKVVLNIHYSSTRNTECRAYEVLGCGTALVSEPMSMDLFPEGLGVRYGDSVPALAQAVEEILDLPEAAYGDFVDAGYRLVHGSYTYTQRCQTLLDTIAKELG